MENEITTAWTKSQDSWISKTQLETHSEEQSLSMVSEMKIIKNLPIIKVFELRISGLKFLNTQAVVIDVNPKVLKIGFGGYIFSWSAIYFYFLSSNLF